MPTIAVDAMGGDFAPDAIVQGVAQVSLHTDIQCILVGHEQRIQKILDGVTYNPENIDIRHASEVISMGESPKEAIRRKRDSSMVVACQLVEQGKADALVSAGNTGAGVLACARHFPMIPGVRKAALASVYPRHVESDGQDYLALLLDVGATIHCDAAELAQFAVMGSAYARRVSKVAAPRIGLLNMGRESSKGGATLIEAYDRLQRSPVVNFVGNVEGNELTGGRADVIVCEGLLGNVVLKLLEGLGEALVDLTVVAQKNWRWRAGLAMLSSGVGRLREITDYATYGGAPILGFQHLFIKAHGRSTAPAIGNSVKVAAKAVRDGVAAEIRAAIEQVA
jgi:glycerol-3-phosphate acyltransferase PlsX